VRAKRAEGFSIFAAGLKLKTRIDAMGMKIFQKFFSH
jgi:hypothetical protein